MLAEIQGAHVMLVLDEYDRVTSEDLRNKLAELIKNLTDSSIPVTLFIVGVAESLDQLLGKHPSIQRSLVAVHLPLMSDKEIDRIIVAGSESAGVGFSDEVRDLIVMLAKGLPYYAQLLALHAARSAVSRGATQVGNNDLAYAVARCVQEAERGIVEAYNKALGSGPESLVRRRAVCGGAVPLGRLRQLPSRRHGPGPGPCGRRAAAAAVAPVSAQPAQRRRAGRRAPAHRGTRRLPLPLPQPDDAAVCADASGQGSRILSDERRYPVWGGKPAVPYRTSYTPRHQT